MDEKIQTKKNLLYNYSSFLNTVTLSYCIGVYNEEKIIEVALTHLQELLDTLYPKDYEIVVVDNGSKDKTWAKLSKLSSSKLRIFRIKKRGHGLSLKKALLESKGKYAFLGAIDLPFGVSDLTVAQKNIENFDIIFGSKTNKKSNYPTSFQRKMASKIYFFFVKSFFKVGITDTQGTILMRLDAVKKFLKKCDSENAFFTTQLAIYSMQNHLRIAEIPVRKYNKKFLMRKSKYNIILDGQKMFRSCIKEYAKIHLM